MAASSLVQGLIDSIDVEQESKAGHEAMNENTQFNLETQLDLTKFKRIGIIGYEIKYLLVIQYNLR